MGFADQLSFIYQKKFQEYKKRMADLRTEKFLNEFDINYEEGLLKEIKSYISYDEERYVEYKFTDDTIVDLVMHHNSWNDLRDI